MAYFGTLTTFFWIIVVAVSVAYERKPDWTCNFNINGDCNITQGHGDNGDWRRERSKIFGERYYGARFDSHNHGDTMVCHLPSVFESISGQLEIRYYSFNGRLDISVCNGGPVVRSLRPTGLPGGRETAKVDITCPSAMKISFTAVNLGGLRRKFVDIYNIRVFEDFPVTSDAPRARSTRKMTMKIDQSPSRISAFGSTSITSAYHINRTAQETTPTVKSTGLTLQTILKAKTLSKGKEKSGAKAAIISVVVVLLVIVTAVFLIVHRRRRAARQDKLSGDYGKHSGAHVYASVIFSASGVDTDHYDVVSDISFSHSLRTQHPSSSLTNPEGSSHPHIQDDGYIEYRAGDPSIFGQGEYMELKKNLDGPTNYEENGEYSVVLGGQDEMDSTKQ